ncbi:hypothetical protein V8B97DRAFT_1274330 [Scleroderma yunnanense]
MSDETLKVNIVPDDFNEEIPADTPNINEFDESARDSSEKYRRQPLQEVKAEGVYLWQLTKQYLLRPRAAGCLIGLGASKSTEFRFTLMLGHTSQYRCDWNSGVLWVCQMGFAKME